MSGSVFETLTRSFVSSLGSVLSRTRARELRRNPPQFWLSALPDLTPDDLRKMASKGFNPSWISASDGFYFALRKNARETLVISAPESFLGKKSPQQNDWLIRTVRTVLHANRDVPVRDLRFFQARGQAWLTFNSGHSADGNPNDLYLSSVEDFLAGRVFRVAFEDRQRTEKNWAFFEEQDSLYALYSLEPLRILKAVSRDESTQEIVFHEVPLRTSEEILVPNRHTNSTLAIGSQIQFREGIAYVVVHEKPYQLGKFRTYIPRILSGILDSSGFSEASIGEGMPHSLDAAIEPSPLNPFAYGVTYGSCVSPEEDSLLLGYGINDCNFRIVDLNHFSKIAR